MTEQNLEKVWNQEMRPGNSPGYRTVIPTLCPCCSGLFIFIVTFSKDREFSYLSNAVSKEMHIRLLKSQLKEVVRKFPSFFSSVHSKEQLHSRSWETI